MFDRFDPLPHHLHHQQHRLASSATEMVKFWVAVIGNIDTVALIVWLDLRASRNKRIAKEDFATTNLHLRCIVSIGQAKVIRATLR